MALRTLLACALLALTTAARAADEHDRFAVKDVGLSTCAQFVAAREAKSPEYFRFGGWLNGYLTAVNRYQPQTFDMAPWQSPGMLTAWLAQLCRKDPETPFVRAVTALANKLGADRLQTHSEMLTLTNGTQFTGIYEAVLRRVQQRLTALGYKGIEADGRFEPPTRAALEAFQRDKALDPTGLPDPATLAKLLQ